MTRIFFCLLAAAGGAGLGAALVLYVDAGMECPQCAAMQEALERTWARERGADGDRDPGADRPHLRPAPAGPEERVLKTCKVVRLYITGVSALVAAFGGYLFVRRR